MEQISIIKQLNIPFPSFTRIPQNTMWNKHDFELLALIENSMENLLLTILTSWLNIYFYLLEIK